MKISKEELNKLNFEDRTTFLQHYSLISIKSSFNILLWVVGFFAFLSCFIISKDFVTPLFAITLFIIFAIFASIESIKRDKAYAEIIENYFDFKIESKGRKK